MVAPLTPDRARIAALRDALPAVDAGIYLNTAAAGPLPAVTARAMAELADVELATGRAHAADAHETLERVGEARAALAALLAADLESVALTRSTDHGIAVALASLDWRPGDRAVIGLDEAAAREAGRGPARGPWGLLQAFGVEVTAVKVDEGPDDALETAIESALTARTRLLAVPHVAGTSGRRLPVAAIADIARARGALVVVDGGCSVGAIQVAPAELGADAVAFPSERWLLGPAGLGGLWCGPTMLERSRMRHPAGFADAASPVNNGPAGGALAGRGTESLNASPGSGWHLPSVVGLARSCGWLSMHVGLSWAWTRASGLARHAATALAAISGVTVLTPMDSMATIVTFRIDGWPAERAVEELGARVFAIVGSLRSSNAIRASLGAFNSEEEVGRFVEAVALLARHVPETMPPRRGLDVLP